MYSPSLILFVVGLALASTPLIFARSLEDITLDSDSAKGFTKLGSFRYNGRNGEVMESTYYISNGRAWWDTVMAECVSSGLGSLLSIETAAKDQVIRQLTRWETYSIWTSGSYEDGPKGTWASTNEAIEYTNYISQPTTSPGYRVNIHTSMQDGSYKWFTSAKNVTKKYICEQKTVIAK